MESQKLRCSCVRNGGLVANAPYFRFRDLGSSSSQNSVVLLDR